MLKRYNIFAFVVLILFSLFLGFGGCKKSALISEVDLIEVPPPEKLPQEKDSVIVIDHVKLTISSYFWQDFMPIIPPKGPPFYLNLAIEIENNSTRPIQGFTVLMTTLYYLDTQKIFHGFRLIPAGNTQPEETILPQERKTLIYTNDREEIFSPQIERGAKLYGRIMVKWNGERYLLTSPPAGVAYTY